MLFKRHGNRLLLRVKNGVCVTVEGVYVVYKVLKWALAELVPDYK